MSLYRETYWIDPNGKLIDTKGKTHNEFAQEYLDENGITLTSICHFVELHKMGWVRAAVRHSGVVTIMGDCSCNTRIMRNTMDPAMNKNQLITAKKLCIENNCDFMDAINH